MKRLNIILFGPPGAGKGTQSEKIIEKFGLVHVSTGDIFRANINGGTELGNLAKNYMEKGELVPDEVTIGMLRSKVESHPDTNGFIFDGFPRTSAQASALDDLLKSLQTEVTGMIALDVPEDELKQRLTERAKTSRRPDDANPEVIKNRISVYNRETAPVKDYYHAQDKYSAIDGVGSVDAIFDLICCAISNIQ